MDNHKTKKINGFTIIIDNVSRTSNLNFVSWYILLWKFLSKVVIFKDDQMLIKYYYIEEKNYSNQKIFISTSHL